MTAPESVPLRIMLDGLEAYNYIWIELRTEMRLLAPYSGALDHWHVRLGGLVLYGGQAVALTWLRTTLAREWPAALALPSCRGPRNTVKVRLTPPQGIHEWEMFSLYRPIRMAHYARDWEQAQRQMAQRVKDARDA